MVQQPVESKLDLQGLRILLAEQDWNTAELLLLILKSAEAEVVKTDSAYAALHHLLNEPIDLVVCNIQLPDMHGHELIQQIRSRPERRINQIPAIALILTVNSYSYAIAERTTTSAGFDRFISLPAEPEEIVNTILALAGKAKGQ
ncbi:MULTISPECIES: response regulator [unclassified Leptolyngbya]|uniref:response regulator n=1 Tax=unclassified Leptolyngbya TaxID=2650499 RepID=UPI001687BA99|nr:MULTISPECIES: response regulator [unclassified Leptolyngbya]MBD1912864.1 response regulator [Leptolyngbya sp. FACHB-8]MBD2157475.1 response regulator [Leptolyngbya sp. FACHB-16]